MSGFLKEAVKNKYSGLPSCPERPGKRIGSPGGPGRKRDYSPLSWKQYFENSKYVCVSDKNMFRVYLSGYEGPVLLLLHGGGHSALSWSVFTVNDLISDYLAFSFKKSINRICHCQVVAIDLRGHGDSKTENDLDLSADTLAKDVGEIVGKLYEGVDSPPPILMVGHSMGGAIAVHVSVKGIIPTLIGLAVIDVVEGTAMEALSSMQSFLKSRPSSFSSLEQGIEWSVRSGQVHNVESARISMVGQLVRFSDNDNNGKERVSPTSPPATNLCEAISEEPEEDNSEATQRATVVTEQVKEKFTWRIDLSKTGHFWEGWFKDMSKLFLSCPVPKLLILAGIERLDKELTIGQMQGKFQMQVLPRCGHCVHEDAPDKVAEVLTGYLVRLKLAAAKDNFQR